MSTVYNLIESSSNSIINVIAWDGSNAEEMAIFTASFGYLLVEITGSDEYYSSLTGSTTASLPSGSIYFGDYDSTQVGTFIGIFTGSASGSFTGSLNGTASYALTASHFTGVAVSALTAISSSYATFAETGSVIEVISKSKNWTKPSWAKKIKVICIGGGGGGGSASDTEDTASIVNGGGGGAGGTISIGEFDASTLPSGSIPISVGGGGFGGNSYSPAVNGGDSMFGDYLIAYGGQAGISGGTYGGNAAFGGSGRPSINFTNTGGGPGGRGSVTEYDNVNGAIKVTVAPSLPLNKQYMTNNWMMGNRGVPASIAPTGGGGGLGYDAEQGGRQDGETSGGSIRIDSPPSVGNIGIVPMTFNSSSHDYLPAFYSKVGLGGKGGNPFTLSPPTDGTLYGGGGGGAYAGGTSGIGGYNSGANGGRGVVIIISET